MTKKQIDHESLPIYRIGSNRLLYVQEVLFNFIVYLLYKNGQDFFDIQYSTVYQNGTEMSGIRHRQPSYKTVLNAICEQNYHYFRFGDIWRIYTLCAPAADDDAGLEVRLRHREPVEVGRLPFNRTWSCQMDILK